MVALCQLLSHRRIIRVVVVTTIIIIAAYPMSHLYQFIRIRGLLRDPALPAHQAGRFRVSLSLLIANQSAESWPCCPNRT